MNLHLMYDEKVISRTIEYFEDVLPGHNRYIIMIPYSGYQCKYVNIHHESVFYVKYGSKDFWKIVGSVSQYSNIICHLLGLNAIRFALRTHHPAITWMVWGADMYSELLPERGFLLCDEKSDCNQSFLGNYNFGKDFIKWLKRKYKVYMQVKAAKFIRFACIGKGDYRLLLHYYPEYSHLERKPFFYYPIDVIIPKSMQEVCTLGNNIMVGNSASPTGNHLRIFKLLSKMELRQRKIIVPVSYGEWKNKIIEEGRQILGDSFYPMTDFLPLEEYNQVLMQTSTFIYGHYRQEAWGNIVVALYIGASVFLEECNPLSDDLHELGCVFFTMDQLKEKLYYKLSDEERKRNREVVEMHFSYEQLTKCIKQSFGA